MAQQHPLVHARLLSSCHCSSTKSPPILPPTHTRVTELVQQVTGQVPEPEQQVLVLELSCEGEDEDTTFPPLHYELCKEAAPLHSNIEPGGTKS